MLRLWNRLISMDEARLTRKVFVYDYRKCKNNWSAEVRQILENVNNIDVFNNMQSCSIPTIQDSMIIAFNNNWCNDLATKPKLRSYILFKDEYCSEKYVKFCTNRQERSLIAQIRFGILALHQKSRVGLKVQTESYR